MYAFSDDEPRNQLPERNRFSHDAASRVMTLPVATVVAAPGTCGARSPFVGEDPSRTVMGSVAVPDGCVATPRTGAGAGRDRADGSRRGVPGADGVASFARAAVGCPICRAAGADAGSR